MLSDSADARERLQLKSTAVDSKTGQADPKIVLCTDHQTYQVRQVHSSNSCFVVQRSQAQQVCENDIFPAPSISSIAQCTATLELAQNSGSVEAYVRLTLPIYDATDRKHEIPEAARKSVFMDDAPFSVYEVREACRIACAFECQDIMWRPNASMLLRLWRSITSAATLKGIEFVNPFAKASMTQMLEEDDFPAGFLDAVLARLVPKNTNLEEGCKSVKACRPIALIAAAVCVLDRVVCVPWTGEILLESCAQSTGVNIANFIGDWRELLPESWRGLAKLETLNVGLFENLSSSLTYSRVSIVGSRIRASPSMRLFRPNSPNLEHQALQGAEARESGTKGSSLRENEYSESELHLTPPIFLVGHPFNPISWMSSIVVPS